MKRSTPIYRSYSFTDKDPIIDKVRTAMKDAGKSNLQVHESSGVSVSTLHNWFMGKTRRPQFATVAAALAACGKKIAITDRRNGK